MDLVGEGTYAMVHIGQTSIPDSIESVTSFIDGLENSLTMQELLHESAQTLYSSLANPSSSMAKPNLKETFQRHTLSSPKFNNLVHKSHDCKRNCSFWFGRTSSM